MLLSTITIFHTNAQPTAWQGYFKPSFPDYAPGGMPDFDERQWGTYNWSYGGAWSHCGPLAVANSLWWLDSEFESNPVSPPTINDHFSLVSAFGAWDDHDSRNVVPLVEKLAWFMDTDGRLTGLLHKGTSAADMQAGDVGRRGHGRVVQSGD